MLHEDRAKVGYGSTISPEGFVAEALRVPVYSLGIIPANIHDESLIIFLFRMSHVGLSVRKPQ
jgi:hypothetical protein